MIETKRSEKKAALILATIAAVEGIFVVINFIGNGSRFMAYLGFGSENSAPLLGWILALIVAAVFVVLSLRLPSVRANLVRPSALKAIAVVLAVFAGILEEMVFRKLLMDFLAAKDLIIILQILISGLVFGIAHGVWGLFGGSIRAALGATLATGVLGAALAVVYIASGRNLAPCIAAHFLINLLIEPGLVLAAVRGEMGSTSHDFAKS